MTESSRWVLVDCFKY